MIRPLDSDLLRTFLAIVDAGSVTGGACRIRRSQSATSLQLKQLEDIIGSPVFHRHGRGITLTKAGERLLPTARRVTHDLDATLADIRDDGLAGRLRVGLPDDHSRTALASIVAAFAEAHPKVELEVFCSFGIGFGAAVDRGALDLAVYEVAHPPKDAEVLRADRLVWMAAHGHDATRDPLPVAVFDRDCWWRDAALTSLEEQGRRYRIVFTSESAVGVRAAVESGIAAGLLSEVAAPDSFTPISGLEHEQPTFLVMKTASRDIGPALRRDPPRNSRGFLRSTVILVQSSTLCTGVLF